MSKNVAFIGLGVMGFPMAGHLVNAGHQVTVYNRTDRKADLWLESHQGLKKPTPAEAAEGADVVMTCVGNDDDLKMVMTGPKGILESIQPGSVIIDHTTTSSSIAREMGQQAQQRQAAFIDAPVSGGQQGADKGSLTIMCGGHPETFEQMKPIIACYGKSVRLMGEIGCGQLTKMVNQIAFAGIIQSLSEALNFAEKAGLDAHQVIDVISKGAAQSWQMENRYKTMLAGQYEHGFAVDWMRKDLAICLDEASNNGSQLPVAALVDQFYEEIQQMGGNRWDTSSLLARLKK